MSSHLSVVRAVAAELATSHTRADVAAAALNPVGAHLGAQAASIWMLDATRRTLQLAYERSDGISATSGFASLDVDADLPGPEAVRSGAALFVSSRAERDARWPAIAATPALIESLVVLPLVAGGVPFGAISYGFPDVRHFDEFDRLALLCVADQCAIAFDRALLYGELRAEAEASDVLAQVSAAAANTEDWRQVAANIVTACSGRLVDTVAIYLREGSVIRRVAAASVTYADVLAPLIDRFPTPLSAPAPNATAVRTGQAVHVPPLDDATLAEYSPSDEYRRAVTDIRYGDAWMLPLLDSGVAFGVMFIGVPPGEAMSDATLKLGHEIAARASAVLHGAMAYGQQAAAVTALHDVLLPANAPHVNGFTIATSYVPFTAGPQLGGDWYDVVPLRDGRLALTVGDVAGHGVPAAAIMGQLRNALRAWLIASHTPAAALAELSSLLAWTGPEATATAVVVVADPRTGRFDWSSAGHPPPLVLDGGGRSRFLPVTDCPPLGVGAERPDWVPPYTDLEGTMDPGGQLLLYSDGLVEGRRRDIDVGLNALATAAAQRQGDTLSQHADGLLAALVDLPDDDICLLIAERDA